MRKILVAATAAAAAFAAPAANAAPFFTVTLTSNSIPIEGNLSLTNSNYFALPLATNYGLTDEAIGALISISGEASLFIEYLGNENAYKNTFTYDSLVITENSYIAGLFDPSTVNGSVYVPAAGLFAGIFSSSGGVSAGIGDPGFAVFLDGPRLSGSSFNSTVLYIGYDDRGAGPDDNHDDMIMRITINAVPEPATWAMMIAGVAAVGISMRRRSQNVRVAFS